MHAIRAMRFLFRQKSLVHTGSPKKTLKNGVLEWPNHDVMIVGVFRLSPLKFAQAAAVKNFGRKTEKGPQQ